MRHRRGAGAAGHRGRHLRRERRRAELPRARELLPGGGAAVDSAGRLVLAPTGAQQDWTVAVVRLVLVLRSARPGVGLRPLVRAAAVVPPAGEPRLGTGTDDFAVAADSAIAPGDATIVVGYQRRFHGVSRGFIAKLAP